MHFGNLPAVPSIVVELVVTDTLNIHLVPMLVLRICIVR